MLKDTLREALKTALKARDKLRLDTLRGLLSDIQYEEVDKNIDHLPDTAVIELLKREVKKRRESLEYAVQGKREELIAQLKEEIGIIEGFMPAQLDEAALTRIITELKTQDPSLNMGAIMKRLKESYAGQYDAKLASDLAKKIAG